MDAADVADDLEKVLFTSEQIQARVAEIAGQIDADYQGPLLISVWNRSQESFTIQPGDRVAQLVVLPITRVSLQVVDTFADSARGEGGFGHTGVR